MTNHTGVRVLLLHLVIVGAIGAMGLPGTVSYFSDSSSASGTIIATDNPTAEAGDSYAIGFGYGNIQLDGTNSEGTSLNYSWTIVDQPSSGTAWLTSGETSTPSFHAVTWEFQTQREATVELMVTDEHGWTDTDQATVQIGGSSSSGGTNAMGTNGQSQSGPLTQTGSQPTASPSMGSNATNESTTPQPTPTESSQQTNASTPTPTPTKTPSDTQTATPEPTATAMDTPTTTAQPPASPTVPSTPTPTATLTETSTPTATPEPTGDK